MRRLNDTLESFILPRGRSDVNKGDATAFVEKAGWGLAAGPSFRSGGRWSPPNRELLDEYLTAQGLRVITARDAKRSRTIRKRACYRSAPAGIWMSVWNKIPPRLMFAVRAVRWYILPNLTPSGSFRATRSQARLSEVSAATPAPHLDCSKNSPSWVTRNCLLGKSCSATTVACDVICRQPEKPGAQAFNFWLSLNLAKPYASYPPKSNERPGTATQPTTRGIKAIFRGGGTEKHCPHSENASPGSGTIAAPTPGLLAS